MTEAMKPTTAESRDGTDPTIIEELPAEVWQAVSGAGVRVVFVWSKEVGEA